MTDINLAPDFRATGKGYANKGGQTANALYGNLQLNNLGLHTEDIHRKLWTYCTGVSTGWSLSGSSAQAASAKYFYPRHIEQDTVDFTLVFPSQFAFDQWVEFAQVHHKTAMRSTGGTRTNAAGVKQGGHPIDFKLYPSRYGAGKNRDGSQRYIYIHEGMHVEGYIVSVKAGHKRFVQAPTAVCSVKVTNDFRHKQSMAPVLFNQVLQKKYEEVLTAFHTEKINKNDDQNHWHDNFIETAGDAVSGVVGGILDFGNLVGFG